VHEVALGSGDRERLAIGRQPATRPRARGHRRSNDRDRAASSGCGHRTRCDCTGGYGSTPAITVSSASCALHSLRSRVRERNGSASISSVPRAGSSSGHPRSPPVVGLDRVERDTRDPARAETRREHRQTGRPRLRSIRPRQRPRHTDEHIGLEQLAQRTRDVFELRRGAVTRSRPRDPGAHRRIAR